MAVDVLSLPMPSVKSLRIRFEGIQKVKPSQRRPSNQRPIITSSMVTEILAAHQHANDVEDLPFHPEDCSSRIVESTIINSTLDSSASKVQCLRYLFEKSVSSWSSLSSSPISPIQSVRSDGSPYDRAKCMARISNFMRKSENTYKSPEKDIVTKDVVSKIRKRWEKLASHAISRLELSSLEHSTTTTRAITQRSSSKTEEIVKRLMKGDKTISSKPPVIANTNTKMEVDSRPEPAVQFQQENTEPFVRGAKRNSVRKLAELFSSSNKTEMEDKPVIKMAKLVDTFVTKEFTSQSQSDCVSTSPDILNNEELPKFERKGSIKKLLQKFDDPLEVTVNLSAAKKFQVSDNPNFLENFTAKVETPHQSDRDSEISENEESSESMLLDDLIEDNTKENGDSSVPEMPPPKYTDHFLGKLGMGQNFCKSESEFDKYFKKKARSSSFTFSSTQKPIEPESFSVPPSPTSSFKRKVVPPARDNVVVQGNGKRCRRLHPDELKLFMQSSADFNAIRSRTVSDIFPSQRKESSF